MGKVVLAVSRRAAGFKKLVVVKILHEDVSRDPELARMFADEVRVAALLNHPNVVQTYDAGKTDGQAWLAM
jgi:serine/threonine-protein kinase